MNDPAVSSIESPRPTRFGLRARTLLHLLILLLVGAAAIAQLFPSRVTPAAAPPGVFSGERAMAHLPVIAAKPHPVGSKAQAEVRDYLIKQLTSFGLKPEVQQVGKLENVLVRLPGSASTGALVVLAHYDSVPAAPGAADNGSGVVALLEVARALAAGPALRNDVILLFDDSEERGPFAGTRDFVNKHPWMADVRMAISLDTAVRGPISINETGDENGWLVKALARAYPGGLWTSLEADGNYESSVFRKAGVQVLDLEANYLFHQQHTREDVAAIVSAGTVQQMGEQTLALAQVIGGMDLANFRAPDRTFFTVLGLVFIHYPASLDLPLGILALLLFILALVFTLRRKLVRWGGLGISLAAGLIGAVAAVAITSAILDKLPGWAHWTPAAWPEWPEVIPPGGWWYFTGLALLTLLIVFALQMLIRRWTTPAARSLAALFIITLAAAIMSAVLTRLAWAFTWPAIIGALAWLIAALTKKRPTWLPELAALVAALPVAVLPLPLLPITFMSDGFNSTFLAMGIWALLLGVLLPVVDGLFGKAEKGKE